VVFYIVGPQTPKQFGDLDVRRDHRGLVDQRLRGVRHRRIQA
jgi:hypothetical protein